MSNKTINLENLLTKLNIKNKDMLEFTHAFTHTSFVNEANFPSQSSYDRLEFLGDSVLGKITTEYIYLKFPKFDSGRMSLLRSNIVDEKTLAEIAMKLNFENYANLGKGERKKNMPVSMYSDMFEAFIGAVYLADGKEKVKEILNEYLFPLIDDFDLDDLKDYKTKLQEHLQSQHKNDLVYETFNISNTPSKPLFNSNVIYSGITLGRGRGRTKKMAEKLAAKNAYTKLVK